MQIGRSGSVECVSMRRGEGGNNKTLFAPLFIQGALGTWIRLCPLEGLICSTKWRGTNKILFVPLAKYFDLTRRASEIPLLEWKQSKKVWKLRENFWPNLFLPAKVGLSCTGSTLNFKRNEIHWLSWNTKWFGEIEIGKWWMQNKEIKNVQP